MKILRLNSFVSSLALLIAIGSLCSCSSHKQLSQEKNGTEKVELSQSSKAWLSTLSTLSFDSLVLVWDIPCSLSDGNASDSVLRDHAVNDTPQDSSAHSHQSAVDCRSSSFVTNPLPAKGNVTTAGKGKLVVYGGRKEERWLAMQDASLSLSDSLASVSKTTEISVIKRKHNPAPYFIGAALALLLCIIAMLRYRNRE